LGTDATHPVSISPFAERFLGKLQFPLAHPARMERNIEADSYSMTTQHSGYREPGLKKALKFILNQVLWFIRG
jgi:hypothetical protein